LDHGFCQAVDLISGCRGSVIVSGIGKAGLVGQKIAATLASTGTRSHFLHPAEAAHGDLGRVSHDDIALILSHSGESEEVVKLLPPLAALHVPIIAVTGRRHSQLAHGASVVLDLGHITEACLLGLAPTTSTTAMMALGDALALVISRMRGFTAAQFARLHPGGSLGRKLTRVRDAMRPLGRCRIASEERSVREVLIGASRPGRRTGAIMLVDAEGTLTGVFTDSDLARLFETRRDGAIDEPISHVMTCPPTTIRDSAMLSEAIALLAEQKFSELPVVDEHRKPSGLIDITDVLELLPHQEPGEARETARATDTTAADTAVIPFPGPAKR
jgi:arabinose-5-phosphate isomerase